MRDGHRLERLGVVEKPQDILNAVLFEAGGEGHLCFLEVEGQRLEAMVPVTGGIPRDDALGAAAVGEEKLHGVRGGESFGVEKLTCEGGVGMHTGAGEQGPDAWIDHDFVAEMLREEPAAEQPEDDDEGQVTGAFVTRGTWERLAEGAEILSVGVDFDAGDVGEACDRLWVKAAGGVECRLHVRSGGRAELKEEGFHHEAPRSALEEDGLAREGDGFEAALGGAEGTRAAGLAGERTECELDGAGGGIARGARGGGAAVGRQWASIEPGVGECGEDGVALSAKEACGDGGGGDAQEEKGLEWALGGGIFLCEQTLNFVRLDKCGEKWPQGGWRAFWQWFVECLELVRVSFVATEPVAECQKDCDVVRRVAAAYPGAGAIGIVPVGAAAQAKGGGGRIEFVVGAWKTCAEGLCRAWHHRAEEACAVGVLQGLHGPGERVEECELGGPVGFLAECGRLAYVVGQLEEHWIVGSGKGGVGRAHGERGFLAGARESVGGVGRVLES